MLIGEKQLLHLPVITKSGYLIGQVVHFEIDLDSQSIIRYWVQPKGVAGFLAEKLSIHRSQVISIDEKKMVVEDKLIKTKIKIKSPLLEKIKGPLEEPAVAPASEIFLRRETKNLT